MWYLRCYEFMACWWAGGRGGYGGDANGSYITYIGDQDGAEGIL